MLTIIHHINANCLPLYSSSRMRVIYHNWSAMKQRPHPQSVAEISHHSVLSRKIVTVYDRLRTFVLCKTDIMSVL